MFSHLIKVIFHFCQNLWEYLFWNWFSPKLQIHKYVASNTKGCNFDIKFAPKSVCQTFMILCRYIKGHKISSTKSSNNTQCPKGGGHKPISQTGLTNALRRSVWVPEGQIHKHHASFWNFGTSRAQKRSKTSQIGSKTGKSQVLGVWRPEMAGSVWIQGGSSPRTSQLTNLKQFWNSGYPQFRARGPRNGRNLAESGSFRSFLVLAVQNSLFCVDRSWI